ncbi:MAG: ferric reductase-like transmembrane domain-containing protein [Thermoplasmatota archaeon]
MAEEGRSGKKDTHLVRPPLLGFLPLEPFSGMKRNQMMTPGGLLSGLLVLSTMIIWLAHGPGSVRDPLIAGAKTCAFLAISTLSVNYILAVRWSVLENLFGGLDRMYRVHKFIGRSSLVFMLLHPIFLGISKLPDWETVLTYVIPIGPWEVAAGVVALYIFVLLIALTVAVRISYHLWHVSHKFLGIVLVLSLVHAVAAGSDLASYPLLRFWVILLSSAGLVSYIYMLILYKQVGPRYSTKVLKVRRIGNITELYIERPENFRFQPGQYIFLRFPRFEGLRELFPFSLSNDPSQDHLRVSIRGSGDFTSEMIPKVRKGDEVIIMGPYGKFGERYLKHDRDMVWIAGGIGITPFLSLAKHESMFPTGRRIDLVWVFRDPQDRGHDPELATEARRNPDFDYVHWISSRKGRIDADAISDLVGGDHELRKRMILMCGPPKMVYSLSRQLHRKGVSYRRMLFEDFNMLD